MSYSLYEAACQPLPEPHISPTAPISPGAPISPFSSHILNSCMLNHLPYSPSVPVYTTTPESSLSTLLFLISLFFAIFKSLQAGMTNEIKIWLKFIIFTTDASTPSKVKVPSHLGHDSISDAQFRNRSRFRDDSIFAWNRNQTFKKLPESESVLELEILSLESESEIFTLIPFLPKSACTSTITILKG